MPVVRHGRPKIVVWKGESHTRPNPGETVCHIACAAGSLVHPFSDFFLNILEIDGLQMLHLNPNVVMTLSMFAYFCKMFVGVRLLVDLFRRFFMARYTSSGNAPPVGCVYFVPRPGSFFLEIPKKISHSKSSITSS
uniref:Transposase (putative) gypsy type domain-containing protein n=1 Tax=Oryza punctata TaxID=4537 RepID=A0A0E0MLI5_ORYPU